MLAVIRFYDSGGSQLSSTDGTRVDIAAGASATLLANATAPAGTAFAGLVIFRTPEAANFANDIFYLDNVLFGPNPGGTYFDGNTATSGTATRFWEWGTIANLGQLTVTNTGNTSSSPTITVGAGGRFVSGFQVVEVETGRVLSYAVGTSSNDQVTLNNRTRRATLNGGGDVTGNLVIRQWFSVPPGASRRYQLVTLGAVSGTPTFSINAAAAYL